MDLNHLSRKIPLPFQRKIWILPSQFYSLRYHFSFSLGFKPISLILSNLALVNWRKWYLSGEKNAPKFHFQPDLPCYFLCLAPLISPQCSNDLQIAKRAQLYWSGALKAQIRTVCANCR